MDDSVAAIESIDKSCTADDRDSRWVEFMLASCELIRPLMPRYALRAFEVARRYWSGDGATKDELTQARVGCWKELDAARLASKPNDPMVYAARATTGLLYPDWATGDDRVTVPEHSRGRTA